MSVCVVIPGLHTNYHGAEITERAQVIGMSFVLNVSFKKQIIGLNEKPDDAIREIINKSPALYPVGNVNLHTNCYEYASSRC